MEKGGQFHVTLGRVRIDVCLLNKLAASMINGINYIFN